jgi:hypothetical protein
MNRRWTALEAASTGFVAANILHTLDHLRQGVGGLTWEILAGCSVLTVLAVAVLVLALRRDQRAPAFAAVVGFSGAVGIASAHIAPHWSALSDSYLDIHADALSWIVMLLEVGAALALGMVALGALIGKNPSTRSMDVARP